MTPSRAAAWGITVGLLCSSVAERAHADHPIFRARRESPELGYRISVRSQLNYARRDDFSRPVFLFNQAVDTIIARELRTELDFRLAVFPSLSLQAVLPISWRQADVRFAPVVISADEVLAPVWRDLAGIGISNSRLALVYHALAEPVRLHFHAGTVIAGDDNPGSTTVATRLPLSTGQTELFVESSAQFACRHWSIEGDYRVGYHLRQAATYLVRQVDRQSYASGALGDFWTHRWRLGGSLFPHERFSFKLTPEWRIDENPTIVHQGKEYRFVREAVRHELGLEGRVRIRLGKHHAFEAFYQHLLLRAWERDPFFPIVIPEHGFGLAWHAWST